MIDIKPFTGEFISDVVKLWNETCIYDQLNAQRFVSIVLADENFDAQHCLLAVDGKKLVGFILGTKRKIPYLDRGLEPKRAFINIMFVKDGYQRKGIGTALLQSFEQLMGTQGVTQITVGAYSPNYFFPGVDMRYKAALSFFEKNNYSFGGEAVSMHRNLTDYVYPQEIKERKDSFVAQGYTFKTFTLEDTDGLLRFLGDEFGGGWKYNLINAIKRGDATETVIVCKNEEAKIVGFVQRSMDGCSDRFGPFGVHESLRSHGLGSVLFHDMMESKVQAKIYHSYFLWTGGRAQDFYTRQGMTVFRTYRMTTKDI